MVIGLKNVLSVDGTTLNSKGNMFNIFLKTIKNVKKEKYNKHYEYFS